MPNQIQVAFRDYDSTRQQTSIDVSAASTPVERLALKNALTVWSAGASDGFVFREEVEAPTGASAATAVAQDDMQLIIEMKDAITGQIYRERLPMPDTAKANDVGGDPAFIPQGQGQASLTVMNPDHDDYATLQSAINQVWLSPNGNAGTFQRAYIEK